MCSSGSSFFEGTEKKVELAIDPALGSLLDRGDDYWAGVARSAGAEILSKMSNGRCNAYLLSESSLLVFDRKLIMLTCGRTTLHDAVLELLHTVPPDGVEMLVYQRKNEAFPHNQPTSFFEDVRLLNEQLPGRAFQFGHEDEHHLYLFHLDREFRDDPEDVTVEVLMYGLDPQVREHFSLRTHRSTAPVREHTRVQEILPGFQLDDHLFEPTGYSLNGIRGDEYYTVHVTPEAVSSYASFETNHRFGDGLHALVTRALGVFRPRSFDLIVFDHGSNADVRLEAYHSHAHVLQELSFGYQVRFKSFHRPLTGTRPAVELPLARREGQAVRR